VNDPIVSDPIVSDPGKGSILMSNRAFAEYLIVPTLQRGNDPFTGIGSKTGQLRRSLHN